MLVFKNIIYIAGVICDRWRYIIIEKGAFAYPVNINFDTL